MNFKMLNPTWEISPEDLADVVQLHPEIADDSAFQKIQQQVEAKFIKDAGLPSVFLGVDIATTTTNATSAYALAMPSSGTEIVAVCRQMQAKMHAIAETGLIAQRLPEWITANRWELAKHLWVAQRVFEHNLSAMAKLHRLPRRF